MLQQSKDSVWILVVLPQIVWGRKRQRRYWNKIGHYCFANIFDQKIYLRAALLSRSFSTDLSMVAVWQRSTAPSEDTEDSLLLWFNPKGSSAAQSLTLPRWNEGRESERWRHKNWWVLTVCASKPKQWFNFLHSISRQAVQRLPGKHGVQRRGAAPDRWGAAGPAPPLPVPPPALGALSGPSWGGRWGGRPCWAGPGRASSFGLCSASALRLKGPQRCAVTVLVALQEACAARELWLSGRNVICVLEKLFVVSACKNCAGVPLNLLQVKAKLQVQWENKYINALFFGSLCLKHKCSENCIRSNKALLIIYYRLVKEEKGSTITFPGSKRSSASVCCCASAKEKTSCNAFILRAHIERAWSHFYIRMAFNSHGESECGGSVTSHVFVAAERCPAHSCSLPLVLGPDIAGSGKWSGWNSPRWMHGWIFLAGLDCSWSRTNRMEEYGAKAARGAFYIDKIPLW